MTTVGAMTYWIEQVVDSKELVGFSTIFTLSRMNQYSIHPVQLVFPKNCRTLTGSKVPEDSSDFDETWTELIVMTWTLIWALLRKFRLKIFFRIPPAGRKYFPESRRPKKKFPDPAGRRMNDCRKNERASKRVSAKSATEEMNCRQNRFLCWWTKR